MEISEFKSAVAKFGLPDQASEEFSRLFARFKASRGSRVDWASINSPDPSRLLSYSSLSGPDERDILQSLSRTVVCKLNGGLGTSMGCRGPKSAIPVKNNLSFLDLIICQLDYLRGTFNVDIPLLLMNSFYTHEDTLKLLDGLSGLNIESFKQSQFLRLDKCTLEPMDPSLLGDDAWYPPGHGNIYFCLKEQGWLDRLIGEGKEILFVSNADNLGAVMDANIAHHMLQNKIPFIMEMTPKTAADIKGGTLYEDSSGQLHLLELAQVPQEHVDEFCSTRKFDVFNTNNIWIHLPSLKIRMEQGPLELNLIVNEKKAAGRPVIQLETAIGSALECFEGAKGIVVGRERFLPVKNTSDLLLIQSNLFFLEKGRLVKNPQLNSRGLPLIRWREPFTQLEEYQKRFPVIPDLSNLESLEIEGDVRFEGAVSLKGKISLISKKEPIIIPAGSVLENQSIVQ